jgi:hypothetical protein
MQDCRARSDHHGVGRLLGFPPCCRDFFHRVWVDERLTDTTWSQARESRPDAPGDIIEVDGRAETNVLNRWLGVRAVHHLPCRFDCAPSVRLGRRHLDALAEIGYVREAAWIEDILSWPAEWSALHGIAEIRNPVVKVVTATDATTAKRVVRWRGEAYPAEGAVGLRFPFRAPGDGVIRPARAGAEPARVPAGRPARHAWYHRDNDFSSVAVMRAAHAPIVALARQALAGRRGAVIDLGCGNGALVRAICARRRTLAPHGVDRNETAIRHAQTLLPRFAGNFVRDDLFHAVQGFGDRRFALALVMAGRLTEAPPDVATAFLARLQAAAERVLLYVHPGYGATLPELASRLGLALDAPTEWTALLARDAALRKPADPAAIAAKMRDAAGGA